METFTKAREFVTNRGFAQSRKVSLAALDLSAIDPPIRDIIVGFARLPHCFTLQCCYGHFICAAEQDPHNLEPIPVEFSGAVRYKIAYIAFCLENSDQGKALFQSLARIPEIDSDFIQFGSADWFWKRWLNSYALQVEPLAQMLRDEAVLESTEARHLQEVRDRFFRGLRGLLAKELDEHGEG